MLDVVESSQAMKISIPTGQMVVKTICNGVFLSCPLTRDAKTVTDFEKMQILPISK